MDSIHKICRMKHTLACWLEEEFSKGKAFLDTDEVGAVVDMVKDLAEAEKDCYKAAYYKDIVESMEHGSGDTEYRPMVFNRYDEFMGHNPTDKQRKHESVYDKYKTARRHYTETHSPEHKQEMDSYASEHVSEAIGTMREIWNGSDPELRRRMKSDLTSLLSEMSM